MEVGRKGRFTERNQKGQIWRMLFYSIQWVSLSILLIGLSAHFQFTWTEYARGSTSWMEANEEGGQSGQWSRKSMERDGALCYYEDSVAREKYTRAPRNTTKRDTFNDIYLNIYDKNRMTKKSEFQFRQDHIIKYYIGSTPDTSPRTENSTFGCFPFDVTMTLQTSCGRRSILMRRTERLFFLKHLLKRWNG